MTQRVFMAGAARTPIGAFGGGLQPLGPLDLIGAVMAEALNRAGLTGDQLDQVFVGNCFAPLEQNVARVSSLLLGLPDHVPGVTINCACSSGMQAMATGAMYIAQGQAQAILVGGVESMSNVPYILENQRWGKRLRDARAVDLLWRSMQEYPVGGGMGLAAERLAQKYGLTREEQDELAEYSHRRAVRAIEEGRFHREILPLEVPSGKGRTKTVDKDEHPRPDATRESLARLAPAFKEGGTVTAGNASGLNDGAAAMILISEERARELKLPVQAEILAHSLAAVDPHLVGVASVPAIRKVLTAASLKVEDIDLFEVNEAFAAYYLPCERELGLDREKTNVNGSGISLGHPVGCTGCRMVVTLYYEMERSGVNRGVAGLCAGGGVGTAVLLER
jgi:acetyl-CoA C-acetyltransferase